MCADGTGNYDTEEQRRDETGDTVKDDHGLDRQQGRRLMVLASQVTSPHTVTTPTSILGGRAAAAVAGRVVGDDTACAVGIGRGFNDLAAADAHGREDVGICIAGGGIFTEVGGGGIQDQGSRLRVMVEGIIEEAVRAEQPRVIACVAGQECY